MVPSTQVVEPVKPCPPHCLYLATEAAGELDATGLVMVAKVVGTPVGIATMLLDLHADFVGTGAAAEVFDLHALLTEVALGTDADGTLVTGSRLLATSEATGAALDAIGAAVVAGIEATGGVVPPELAPSQTAGPGISYDVYAP